MIIMLAGQYLPGSVCRKGSSCRKVHCSWGHTSQRNGKIVDLVRRFDSVQTRSGPCRYGPICYNAACGYAHPVGQKGRLELGLGKAGVSMTLGTTGAAGGRVIGGVGLTGGHIGRTTGVAGGHIGVAPGVVGNHRWGLIR